MINNVTNYKPKICILLLVHNNEIQINKLINHLSKDFDIYVHIDKRSSLKIIKNDKVFTYKKYKAYWGSFNLVMASLFLLKEAYQRKYDRYILISGQDLPLKTNAEIAAFFTNNDHEYLTIKKIYNSTGWPSIKRVTHYNPNHIERGNKSPVNKLLFWVNSKFFSVLSRIKPRHLDYDFYGGQYWTNYTHNCVKKIFEYLEKDKNYIPRFRWTSCGDEIFYHTIIHQLEGLKIENDFLRYVDWKTGPERPRTLRMEDVEKMFNGNNLFARKFDMKVDNKVIEYIYNYLKEKEHQVKATFN